MTYEFQAVNVIAATIAQQAAIKSDCDAHTD